MEYRLLVIEGDGVPTDASVCTALAEDRTYYSCHPVNWDDLVPQSLGHAEAHAVVAVAIPQTPKVTSVLHWLRDNPIATPTFAVLPTEVAEPLLRMASETADDFMVAPLRKNELRHRLARMLGPPGQDLESVRLRLAHEMGLSQLIGSAPTFVRALEHVQLMARSDAPVVITGETGTGKELCARAIHHLGNRRSFPFIAVDCAAVPDHLFENEMFGHARGAFTDAHSAYKGLVAMAEGGTLFLDEVDALSLTAQAKLLRFLQERTYKPLGSERFMHSDVGVITASNRDLEACVRAQQLRSDLYFRLNVFRLHLPPLRERPSDIDLLADHFLGAFRTPAASLPKAFSPAALRKLALHDWPGNVRELANVVQRAVVVSEGPVILPSHISLPATAPTSVDASGDFRTARAAAVASFERSYVEDLLRKHGGNVTRAAKEAEKDRRAFGRLVKKYSIAR